MGIREDIRKAIGCIVAAVPDATHKVRHGDDVWTAIQATRTDFAEVRADGPAEDAAFYLSGSAFDGIGSGNVVELDGVPRAVTSLRMDQVGASLRIGLSAELVAVAAVIEAHGQHVETTVRACVYDDDGITQGGGGFWQSDGENVTVFVSEEEWHGSELPKFGVRLGWNGRTATVQHVSKGDGFWKLDAVCSMMERSGQ